MSNSKIRSNQYCEAGISLAAKSIREDANLIRPKRNLMLISFLFILLPGSVCVSAQERPNIVFAFADDWGRYASAYAEIDTRPGPNSIIRTPNFDQIAKKGVLFRNAFVTAPSCTPCRSSLLSGQYFFRTGMGAILSGATWDRAIPSYPLLLRDAGYHIGQTYKVWSPGSPRDAPYGAREYEYESAGTRFNGFSQNVTNLVAEGSSVAAAKEVLFDEVRENFDGFMDKRPDGKPFCYWFGPTNVHRKWIPGSGKKLWGIDPKELIGKMPKFLPDEAVVREDFADYLGEAMAFDAALGVLIHELEKRGELDKTMIVVSGDHGAPGFPRGKTNLYDFGTSVSLAACWPGQVPGGRVVDDFVNLMDLAPTFLEAGGVDPPPVMTGKSLMNVLNSKGSGQIDPERTWVVTGRERHVANAREGYLPYPQRSIRTSEFLYVRNFQPNRWPMGTPRRLEEGLSPSEEELTNNTGVTFSDVDASPTKSWLVLNLTNLGDRGKYYFDLAFAKRPAEELYDLRVDSDQVINVADDPGYADKKREFSTKLMEVLRQAKDPRVLGDGSTFDKPPYAGQPRRPKRPEKAK